MTKKLKLGGLFFMSALVSGCMTFSGDHLAQLQPIQPKVSPPIEYTVGSEFDYSIDGGAMSSSVTMGQRINEGVLKFWKENRYISRSNYVKRENFTGAAEYNLTLEGQLDGEGSIFLQTISGLTLFLIPSYVDASAHLTFKLENTITGEKYTSKVYDTINMTAWIIFLPALPFMYSGENDLYERIAEHVYQDFVKQGAFLPKGRIASEPIENMYKPVISNPAAIAEPEVEKSLIAPSSSSITNTAIKATPVIKPSEKVFTQTEETGLDPIVLRNEITAEVKTQIPDKNCAQDVIKSAAFSIKLNQLIQASSIASKSTFAKEKKELLNAIKEFCNK